MERTFGLSPRQHRTLLGMLLGQKMAEWYHRPANRRTRTPSFTPVSCQNAAFASLFWANTALSTQKADARCHHSRFICPQAGKALPKPHVNAALWYEARNPTPSASPKRARRLRTPASAPLRSRFHRPCVPRPPSRGAPPTGSSGRSSQPAGTCARTCRRPS